MNGSDSERASVQPIEDLTIEQRTVLAKLYFDAARDAAKEFDQRVFWLAAGAAGAFGYMQARLPAPSEWACPCLVVIGWVLLYVALVAVMYSFLSASRIHLIWAKYWLWDDAAAGDRAASEGRRIDAANYVSLTSLFLGIAFLGVFMWTNFP